MNPLTVYNARPRSVAKTYKEMHARKSMRGNAKRAAAIPVVLLFALVPFLGSADAGTEAGVPAGILDPLKIPKWVNQLDGPPPAWTATPVYDDAGALVAYNYTVEMTSFSQQILPSPFPQTPVWGYAGYAYDSVTGESLGFVRSSPGASFEAERGVPVNVKWVNSITEEHMFAVDPTLHWANPNDMMMPEGPDFEPYPDGYDEAQSPVPLVTHLHGGEVQSTNDGGPDAWFTNDGKHGMTYNSVSPTDSNAAIYHYPNAQPATTLWYHDHALGITRINVAAGLAGFYLLRDVDDPISYLLPPGKYDIPLVFQDRTFNTDGTFFFDSAGLNPDVHPYWTPEFFGNTIMVNGKVWPNMDVDQGLYRFRLLDGSNARFYTVSFSNMMPFTVIATDGGYLKSPVTVTKLTIAPGERYEILADFSSLDPGTKVVLTNNAKSPFPSGKPPQGATLGQLVQFTVTGEAGFEKLSLPANLNPYIGSSFPSLDPPTKTRYLVLTEVMGANGPVEILLNGQKWHADISEKPVLGTTEEWVIVNPTMDTHPIHLHLVQFQLVSRQRMDVMQYEQDWMMLNGGMMPPYHMTPEELPVDGYLQGKPRAAHAWEQGWKDTVQMNPGEVTIIRVKFAPIDGSELYPFDPTQGPGYVWHCHILDHEDNEMMRPYVIVAATTPDE